MQNSDLGGNDYWFTALGGQVIFCSSLMTLWREKKRAH